MVGQIDRSVWSEGAVTWWMSQGGVRVALRMRIFWRGLCVESVSRPIVKRASVPHHTQ